MARSDSQANEADTAFDPLAEDGLFTLHKELSLPQIFTAREVGVVQRLQEFCRAGENRFTGDVRSALEQGFERLGTIATALAAYPSLRQQGRLGNLQRSETTLMRRLLQAGEHGLEWVIPTKAVLARTFGIAKVNFWTSVRYALQACDADRAAALQQEVLESIEESVYTRLAEELYASYVTSRVMSQKVKRLAIAQIIEIWEGRIGFATDRFCPILRSAWAARCRTPRAFGTLMGTSEIASLLFQDCDARFLDSFTSRSNDSDEVQAFGEFIFDLPFESLEKLGTLMKEEGRDVVGPEEVATYLGLGKLNPLIEDPKALYTSFRKRRVKAQYRTSMRVAGPKRTAESYVLERILLAEDEEAGRTETSGED